MTKVKLFQMAGFDKDSILRTLDVAYRNQIRLELNRILGYAKEESIEHIECSVYTRLQEISSDCDIGHLVFDCVRKEAVRVCKIRSNSLCPKAARLREAKWIENPSEKDDIRIDLLLRFLSRKQRKYFLDRYYYFREDTPRISGYECVILRLINGKGVTSFRFRELKIPGRLVHPEDYVDYLDRLNGFYLGQFQEHGRLLESPRIDGVPGVVRAMERHYLNAIHVLPLVMIAFLIIMLRLWCLFTF